MKTFGRLILLLVFIVFVSSGFAQNFLESGIKPNKTYILLAHPTVQNLETVHFLLQNNILQLSDAEFIGVYSDEESYDYNRSVNLIKKPEMNRFHLQKVEGKEIGKASCREKVW